MNIIQRIRKTKNYLETTLRYLREGKNEIIVPFSTEINEEGYIIRKSDRFVKQNKVIYCLCGFSRFIDTNGQYVSVPVIVTDDLFDELSENTKRFIILHELGHFNLHIDKIVAQANYTRNLNDEFQADEYAIPELGVENVIKALKEMKDTVFLPELSIEINKRIKNIRNKNRG